MLCNTQSRDKERTVKFVQSGAETRKIFGRRKDPEHEHQCQKLERDMRLRKKGVGVRES